jgi:hypothetical protein
MHDPTESQPKSRLGLLTIKKEKHKEKKNLALINGTRVKDNENY